MWIDLIISGLVQSSIYALLAVGFSLIFGVAKILNLAHTAFYMLAAYLIYWGVHAFELPLILAILLSLLSSILLGVLSYKWLIHPIREHSTAVMIATVALAIIIQESILMGFGSEQHSLPALIEGFWVIQGTRITFQNLFIIVTVWFCLGGVWGVLNHTRFGMAVRCVAQDPEVASLMGISVARVSMQTMALSVGLATLAGVVVAPASILVPSMWMHPLVMTMAIVILGGLGSLKGSVIGAFLLGFAESIVVFTLSDGSFLKGAVALSILIGILLIRPEGLYGVLFEEER